jgi:hypothetical protein
MSPILGARGGLSAKAYGFTSAVAAATSYESIATVTVGSGGSSSVTFSSIPSTFTHLQIRGISKGTSSATNAILRFNGDTASNYSFHILYGNTGGAQVTGAGGNGFIYIGNQSATANTFSAEIIDILDYSSTSKNKTVRALCGYENNSDGESGLFSGGWFNSSTAISSITLSLTATFSQYSQFALYGIKGA